MLCVHALLAEAPPPGELNSIQCGQLWAAVTDVDAAPAVDESNLRAYEKIVRDLAARVDAILPARFGSVVADAAELARLLAPREADLLAALALVKGREQMTLRIDLPVPAPSSGTGLGAGPGTRYLQSKTLPLPPLDVVRHLVMAEHIEAARKSVYHLIERGRAPEYRAALVGVAHVTISGPWPPYAFSRWKI